mmetsp:Transcript_18343/g.49308  ORF Transcript_18343/g.49308 Transcript_18343/m.49308 type:complete len:203 (+) Transcript_18343:252-860(+)
MMVGAPTFQWQRRNAPHKQKRLHLCVRPTHKCSLPLARQLHHSEGPAVATECSTLRFRAQNAPRFEGRSASRHRFHQPRICDPARTSRQPCNGERASTAGSPTRWLTDRTVPPHPAPRQPPFLRRQKYSHCELRRLRQSGQRASQTRVPSAHTVGRSAPRCSGNGIHRCLRWRKLGQQQRLQLRSPLRSAWEQWPPTCCSMD